MKKCTKIGGQYTVEVASSVDLPALQALDFAAWGHMRSDIASIEAFTIKGVTWVLRDAPGVKILASVYTQRIRDLDELSTCTYETVHQLHSTEGSILQLLGLQSLPDWAHLPSSSSFPDPSTPTSACTSPVGLHLLEIILERAKHDPDLEKVVAVTRCRQYKFVSSDMSMEDYLKEIGENRRSDYGLELHTSRGAEIVRGIKGYRPYDNDNLSYGVLVSYDRGAIHLGGVAEAEPKAHGLRPGFQTESIVSDLQECLGTVVGRARAAKISKDIPLMKAGLDSLEVVQFQSVLQTRFSVDLASTFLFDYPTLQHIVDYLTGQGGTSPSMEIQISEASNGHLIAIVGISFRFPHGISDFRAFWGLLDGARSTSTRVPLERWDVDALLAFDLAAEGDDTRNAVQHGSFLGGVDLFDAAYFNISSNEAMEMDPQHRLLLEEVDMAVADSNIACDKDTGIFVSLSGSDFARLPEHGPGGSKSIYAATGSAAAVAAGRISYHYGFEGPSMVVDTACSSSLVALHIACTSLSRKECSSAIVAACNLMLTPGLTLSYAKAGMLSVDGRCHTFDESANGYVRGEGCTALLLKRREDTKDGMYAVVRGSAVRQDGISASLTAPNGKSQQALLRQTLDNAKVAAHQVSYLEAHGTGTPLGDPIEMGAVAAVYGPSRSSEFPLIVDSVKGNLGHLEHAAGLAGLLVVIMVLQNGQAPPNAQLRTLNPRVASAVQGFAFKFPTEVLPLTSSRNGSARVGAVSSFGYSGTIAHALVEQPPEDSKREIASCERRVREIAGEGIVFLFTGQGSQYVGMGAELYASEEVFKSALDECDRHIQAVAGYSIKDMLYGPIPAEGKGSINNTQHAQAAILSVEYALAQLWISKGVRPTGVLGHSIGEYAAAVIAEVMSLEDGVRLVSERGRLMQSLPTGEGSMVAIRCSLDTAEEAINRSQGSGENIDVSVAAENGAESIVLSGAVSDLDKVLSELKGYKSTRLGTSHAFHSPLMAPILEDFRSEVKKVGLSPAKKIDFFSTKTGSLACEEIAKPEYWVEHISDRVRFRDGMKALLNAGPRLLVEVGPRGILSRLGQSIAEEIGINDVRWSISMESGRDSSLTFANAYSAVRQLRRGEGKLSFPWQRSLHPLLQKQRLLGDHTVEYRAAMHERLLEVYQDHVIDGMPTLPWACYIEMAIAAVANIHDLEGGVGLKELSFRLMELPSCGCQWRLEVDSSACAFSFKSNSGKGSGIAMQGSGQFELDGRRDVPSVLDLQEAKRRCLREEDIGVVYQNLKAVGLSYGKHFRILDKVWTGDEEVIGQLRVPSDLSNYHVHPILLDGVFQLSCYLLGNEGTERDGPMIPFSIKRASWISRIEEGLGGAVWAYSRLIKRDHDEAVFECALYGSGGEPILIMEGLRIRLISMASQGIARKPRILEEQWVEVMAPERTRFTIPSEALLLHGQETRVIAAELSEVWVRSSTFKSLKAVEVFYGEGLEGAAASAKDFKDETKVFDLLSDQNWSCIILVFGDGKKNGCEPRIDALKILTSLLKGMVQAGQMYRVVVTELAGCEGEGREKDRDLLNLSCGLSVIQGLARSARMELVGQGLCLTVIESDECEDVPNLAHQISSEAEVTAGSGDVKYHKGKRLVPRMRLYKPTLDRLDKVLDGGNDAERSGTGGTFIITGGLGGLGLVTAEALIKQGVQSIVLCSRTGQILREGQGLESRLEILREKKGCKIHVMKCDVSKEDDVLRLLEEVRALGPPLKGIIHAAGLIKDQLIANQDMGSLDEVLDSKAKAAWLLHLHTLGDDLEAFVVFSSIASAIGSVGRAPYSAANAYLDGLVRWRYAHGLPAVSIQWPSILDVGMVAPSTGPAHNFLEVSISSADVEQVMGTLDYRAGCCVQTVMPVVLLEEDRVPRFLKEVFVDVLPPSRKRESTRDVSVGPKDKVAKEAKDKTKMEIGKVVRAEASKVATKTLQDDTPFISAGVTSLDAMELANLLSARFNLKLSSMILFDHPTIRELTKHILEQLCGADVDERPNTMGRVKMVYENSGVEGIAVVGVSCRTPGGVSDLKSFWDLVSHGQVVISRFPETRCSLDSLRPRFLDEKNVSCVQYGGFLEDIDFFDAKFFGVSEVEAAELDLQQRLLLEVSYESCNDAGYSQDTLRGSDTGVYVAMASSNYARSFEGLPSPYFATGCSASIAAGRISYFFGLQGPSMFLDTACSSSVVALHEARLSLQRRLIDLALVSAVNVIFPAMSVALTAAGMLSPDGRCYSFDARANGYVRSEVVASLVLKRLSDLEKQKDKVYGVIRGCAVAQYGARASLTAIHGRGQESVLRQALADAGVSGRDVDYLEAHGTGTLIGDAIEIGAVAEVYGKGRPVDKVLTVGCVKANIGHAEASSGLVGIIHAMLVLHHGVAPPNTLLESLSKNTRDFIEEVPITFSKAAEPLRGHSKKPLLAGFSSFGYSGTVSHVIIEEAPKDMTPDLVSVRTVPFFPYRTRFPVEWGSPTAHVDRDVKQSTHVHNYLQDIKEGHMTISEALQQLWESTLGRSLEAHELRDTSFFQLGASSLLLPKIGYSIRRTLGIDITMADFWKHNTMEKLEHLCEQKISALNALEDSVDVDCEDELPPREDLSLRGMELVYDQMVDRGSAVIFFFFLVKDAREKLTDDVLQAGLRALQEENPFLSCTIRTKKYNKRLFVPTTRKIPFFVEETRQLPQTGDKRLQQAVEDVASFETSISPRWIRGQDPQFCLVKYLSKGDSQDLGLLFSVSHAISDPNLVFWIKTFFQMCSDHIAGRPHPIKRYKLPKSMLDLVIWEKNSSNLGDLTAKLRHLNPATIGTPSRHFPRKTLYKRYVSFMRFPFSF